VLLVVVALAVVPLLSPADLSTLKLMVYFSLISLSLTVLTGWVGQISLAQAALVGIGGFMAAKLANEFALPFGAVVVIAPLLVVPFAVAVGLPAVRFRGLLLALVTLAFGTLTYFSLFQWQPFTGGLDGNRVPAPSLFGTTMDSEAYALLMIVVAAGVFWLARNVIRNRVGDAFLAVRESEDSAAAAGISVIATKLTAFSLSGVIAGIAGALFAYEVQTVSFDQYSPFTSFNVFALAVFAGVESLWGAVIAGVLFAGAPVVLDFLPFSVNAQLLSSVGVLVTLMVLPGGLVRLPTVLRARPSRVPLATPIEEAA
jgi:ABC-type branched-subunit amino acid transport system permease subunit